MHASTLIAQDRESSSPPLASSDLPSPAARGASGAHAVRTMGDAACRPSVPGRWSFGAALVAALLGVADLAGAELVAGWNFNGFNPQTDLTVAADRGSGLIDLNEVAGGLNAFAGTTANAVTGDAAGLALSFVGQSLNGRSIYIHADVGSATQMTISFAARRTDTGFSDNRLELWVAGAWTTVGTFAAGSDWPVSRFDFEMPSMLGVGTATLRLTLGGATTATGNLRLDNLRVETRAVPTPGALALLGLAGLASRRRRR